jgi:hypothetical protein
MRDCVRSTSTELPKIADRLDVSLDWLLRPSNAVEKQEGLRQGKVR